MSEDKEEYKVRVLGLEIPYSKFSRIVCNPGSDSVMVWFLDGDRAGIHHISNVADVIWVMEKLVFFRPELFKVIALSRNLIEIGKPEAPKSILFEVGEPACYKCVNCQMTFVSEMKNYFNCAWRFNKFCSAICSEQYYHDLWKGLRERK